MIYQTIVEKMSIDKGWSGDRKCRVVTADGMVYLLRISPAELYARKKKQFDFMKQAE